MTTPRTTVKKASAAPVKTATARKAALGATVPVKPVEEQSETFLIHFVRPGLFFFGYDWQPGQELEIVKPSDDFNRTCDATGKSWLQMSEEDQVKRWGEVKFRKGPSTIPNAVINYRKMPSDGFDAFGRPKFSGYMSIVERDIAARAEKERGRKVPIV